MYWLAKYGVQTSFRFSMIKRGVVDLAATADWTPATGDVKISLNGATAGNTTNLPTAIAGAGSVGWNLTLTAAELTTSDVYVQIVDSATKAVEDNSFVVYTYGNAAAKIPADLSDTVRLGLTALPNANAEAAGGLFTRGTGAGQINQPANGMIDGNVVRWLNSVVNALITGRVDASVGAMAASVMTRASFAADSGLQNIRAGTAQAGSTSTTIVLDSGASATDDMYNNCIVIITGGTGVGQAPRWIRDYTGSTKTVAIARAWLVTPDNTSTFAIMPNVSGWDEFVADHTTAATFGATTGQSLSTSELIDNLVGPLATVQANGANTATVFQIDIATVTEAAANWWNDAWLSFDLTSALAGQVKKITAFNQSTGMVTVASAYTAIPTATNTARIVTR